MLLSSSISYAAPYNEIALLEDVENEYTGYRLASSRLQTIAFNDVPNGHWAKEPIARAGATELIKGWDDKFYPTKNVSRAEMLAICIRLMGRNTEAETLTDTITTNWDTKNVNMKDLWAIGHMQLTRDLGFISDTDYNDAMYPDQLALNERENFLMGNGAYRYEVAEWICRTLEVIAPDDVVYDFHYSNIYKYNDWNSIPTDQRIYVDLLNKLEIMIGNDGVFRPNDRITRAEVAKLLENLDEYYYTSAGLTKKMGYVSDIVKDIYQANDEDTRGIYTYVRTANGKEDRIFTTQSKNNIGQITKNEIIVYKGGSVGTASKLAKGDNINYLVNGDNEVVYVEVMSDDLRDINAHIFDMSDMENGHMVLLLNNGQYFDAVLKNELYDPETDSLWIDETRYKLSALPFTTSYTFTIKGNMITKITYLGEEELFDELRGVVKEINTHEKTITIYDDKANIVTKKYNVDTQVEKQEYYESQDEVGYIDEVFKEYMFDKMDSSVDNIDVGDTVYLRFNQDGSIKKIDVGTNYGVKYGKVVQINYQGIEGTSLVIKYDDESSDTLELDKDVIVKKNGIRQTVSSLVIGDYVRLLYNRGVINVNNVKESVKQINISNVDEQITDILKGNLEYVDKYQGRMNFSNVERLEPTGWIDFMNVKSLKIAKDCLYYDEDKRVSLDYINEHMIKYGTAYIAIGKNLGEDEIVKITFRASRETVLSEDNVNYAKGNGEFKLMASNDSYTAGEGTIIRRYGRMVDKEAITVPDLAKVILNGKYNAAIIDIKEELSNEAIGVYRAKIKSITDRQSFEVYSFSKLLDMKWSYMNLDRNFVINSNTEIYQGGQRIMYYDFIDYTEASQIDNIYTVIADGDEALLLTDIPYTKQGVTGTIYKIEGNTLWLKDAVSYNLDSSSWEEISQSDRTLGVTPDASAVIIKNNEIVDDSIFKVGDKIRAMGIDDGYQIKKSNGTYNGYIIFVER
ncbi:MAG: S-layer homology domain-containing protein [Clostridia bacterium]|nr:S-layer homology domain-containing protein [Clostridia bacterium]